jgi:hypothetical protein
VTEHPVFDVERAYRHIEELCYPRRVGTPRERRAARYILRNFASFGLSRRREAFPVSLLSNEIGSRLIFASCTLLIVLGAWAVPAWPIVASACWGLAAFLVNSPWRVAGPFDRFWPSRTTSENLVGAPAAGPAGAPARIVFMAHYDTKSQVLPTGVRVALVTIAAPLCVLLAVLALGTACGVRSGYLPDVMAGLSAFSAVLLLGLTANLTGNRSPGALDNGSGVGTLLELARTWRPRPGAPAEVVWIASGAEEVGLVGAKAVLEGYESWWREKPTLLINLESVGAGARVLLAGEPISVQLASDMANGLGFAHARFKALGAGMDHEPFAARSLTSLSIMGDVVRNSLAFHSPRDNMGIIQKPALERAGLLAAHLAWSWAEMHRTVVVGVPAEAGLAGEEIGMASEEVEMRPVG